MSDDDGTPIKEKIYSTPESKNKSRSKFDNILNELELKMPKQKTNLRKTEDDSTNSKLDTSNSNNKESTKDTKNKSQSNSKTNNNKQNTKGIRKFNSFEEGSLKKTNKKKVHNSISKSNEPIEKNPNKNKTKKFTKISNLNTNSSTGNLSMRLNHDNRFNRKDLMITPKNNSKNSSNFNSKNKKEKIRPATPGIRTMENNSDSKNKKNKRNSLIQTIPANMNLNSPNVNVNNSNNKEKKSSQSTKELIDPLYIPHIIKDPLDILRHQVDLILEQSNDDICNLSNNISLIDMEMESSFAKIHENYSKELQDLYKEKEIKLRETNKKYDYALYKMFKTYGHENNIIYDEMMKDKEEQISEVEQEFNAKKNQIKNNLNLKIEEVKKVYEKKRQEQEISNSNMVKEIKKKIFDILYEGEKKPEKKNVSTDKKSRKKKAISTGKK